LRLSSPPLSSQAEKEIEREMDGVRELERELEREADRQTHTHAQKSRDREIKRIEPEKERGVVGREIVLSRENKD
jgi:hypothetical protein